MSAVSILIVDDDAGNLLALEAVLKDTGHAVVRANSGREALKAILAQDFALILMDVQMPELDGYETVELMRRRERSRLTPIIFLTGNNKAETHVFKGYSVGAVDYLFKPVVPEVLLSKVSVFVELYTQRQALHEQTQALQRAYGDLEQRVLERTSELATANRAKSDFLSSMSHELRTPLNAILGYAQMMQVDAAPITPSQKASLDRIVRAGWYLLELINPLLDLAQIEADKLSLVSEQVSLSDVMVECQAMIEPQRQARGISMTFPRFDLPCVVDADRTRLKQVIINLLSNALKYNRAGGQVVVECTTSTPERVRISVRDTGEGLPPDKLAQLFQSFNRLGQEAGAEEGTGIGLVVSKRLVERMGGVIGVESTAGVGSVFWIELIATAAPAVDPDPERSRPTAADPQVLLGGRLRTLLYVEDNPANLALVEQLIGRCADLRLLSARTGPLGIEVARASQPEVILMDMNLPGLSGLEALKILREDPVTAHIPIVALSSNAMPRDIRKGLEAGFFRYLTKPIKLNELMDTLGMALEFAEQEARPRT